MRRIAVLMAYVGPVAQSEFKAFQGALTKLGWAEGSNLRTEVRWGAGDADKIRSFAKELVDLRPDVIVGHSTTVVIALGRVALDFPVSVRGSFPQQLL
jgi:putative tryptophan/tyrosine transport system substrate-binding protein